MIQADVVLHISSDYNYMYLASLICDHINHHCIEKIEYGFVCFLVKA